MSMRRRGAAPGAARAAALAAPGLVVLAAGLAVTGSGPASAAAAPQLPCEGGAGDVPALVAAVRRGGEIQLAPGCRYRVAERYGDSSVLPVTTADTAVEGHRATIAWEGVAIAGSLFDVRGPARLTVRNLRLTSSGHTVPVMVRTGKGASSSVENTSVLGTGTPNSARDEAPAPRPITRAAADGRPAAGARTADRGECGRPAPAAPLRGGPMTAVIPVAARDSGARAGDGRSCGVRAVRA